MILNGKAKEEFYKWIEENDYPISLFILKENSSVFHPSILNALIIDFFDSVGIYIDIRIEFNDSFVLKTFDSYAEDDYVGNFTSRQEATIQAIKKANEIYNENKIIKES